MNENVLQLFTHDLASHVHSNQPWVVPEIFERGGPEATRIMYKNLERGSPKSLKMAFECSFLFQIFHPGGGGGAGPPGPPLP